MTSHKRKRTPSGTPPTALRIQHTPESYPNINSRLTTTANLMPPPSTTPQYLANGTQLINSVHLQIKNWKERFRVNGINVPDVVWVCENDARSQKDLTAYMLTCSLPFKSLERCNLTDARIFMRIALEEFVPPGAAAQNATRGAETRQYLSVTHDQKLYLQRKRASFDLCHPLRFSEALLHDFAKDANFVVHFELHLEKRTTDEESLLTESLETSLSNHQLIFSSSSTPFKVFHKKYANVRHSEPTPITTIAQAKKFKEDIHTLATTTHTNPTLQTYTEILEKLMELYTYLSPMEQERAKEEAREVFLPIQSQTQASDLVSATSSAAHSDSASAMTATPLSAAFPLDPFMGQMEEHLHGDMIDESSYG